MYRDGEPLSCDFRRLVNANDKKIQDILWEYFGEKNKSKSVPVNHRI